MRAARCQVCRRIGVRDAREIKGLATSRGHVTLITREVTACSSLHELTPASRDYSNATAGQDHTLAQCVIKWPVNRATKVRTECRQMCRRIVARDA